MAPIFRVHREMLNIECTWSFGVIPSLLCLSGLLCVRAEQDIWILDLTGRSTRWANLFTPGGISQHGSWNARAHHESPSWSPSPHRTAASAAEDPVEKKRCRSESDFCPPAAVCLLLSCPVRRSQQLPALVRMWWAFSVATGSFWCLTLFDWSCSPVPGVRGSSRWPRAQLSSSSSCTIVVKPRKVFGCEENLLILTVLSPLRGFPDTSVLLCCSATLWRLYVIEGGIEKNLLKVSGVSCSSVFPSSPAFLLQDCGSSRPTPLPCSSWVPTQLQQSSHCCTSPGWLHQLPAR